MNGFLNKKINHRIKNWLAPVKYAKMQSKNAVRNQYTNLYAYAANNPIHYTDPTGNFYASYETETITVDITNKEDMRLAENFMSKNEGFTCFALNKNGEGVEFKNIEGLKAFNKIDSTSTDYLGIIENVVSALGNSTFVISEVGKTAAELKMISSNLEKIANNLGTASNVFGFGSLIIDVGQWYSDKNVSNFLDILITATGFIPGSGPYISTALSSAKQGITFSSEQIAKYNNYLEKKFVNDYTSSFFGFKVW